MLVNFRRVLFVGAVAATGVFGPLGCRADGESDFDRGERLLQQKNYREAIAAYEAAEQKEPGSARTMRQLGMVYLALGDRAAAIKSLEVSSDRAPTDTTVRLTLGQLYLAGGRADEAIREANAVLDQAPANVAALNIAGAAQLARNEPAKAVETYGKIAKLAPKDAKAQYQVGVALMAAGEASQALARFESVLALSPTFFEALAKILSIDVAAKRSDAAIARVKKQIAVVGDSVALKELLAIAYATSGDRARAEVTFREVIRRSPAHLAPYVRLGELYRDWGRYDEAIAVVRSALKVEPRNVDLMLVMGVTYEAKGDRVGARLAYEAALALDPAFVIAGNNLAMLLAESGTQLDRALQVITTARQADPANPALTDTFGWVLFKRGDFANAVTTLAEAAAKLPGEPTVAYHLGMAEAKAGDSTAARRDLQRAVSSASTFPEMAAAKKALAALK